MRYRTARLDVRHWSCWRGDERRRQRLHSRLTAILTPAVLEHLPDAVRDLSGGIAAWVDARDGVSSVHTVCRRDEIAGLLFLFAPPDGDAVHLGYLFAEEVWGQGLASELVGGLVQHWPADQPVRLMAGVAMGNPASARVLIKAGFAQTGTDGYTGLVHFARQVP